MDFQLFFFQQCSGMAFLMSAKVNGGGAARPFPVCSKTHAYAEIISKQPITCSVHRHGRLQRGFYGKDRKLLYDRGKVDPKLPSYHADKRTIEYLRTIHQKQLSKMCK